MGDIMNNEAKIRTFEKAQQELVDYFKKKMKLCADEVLSTFYTDVTQYADTDAHVNYLNYLKDVFRDEIIREVAEADYSHYSWAHSIRMALMEQYPEKIQSKIITDLQGKIVSLEDQIEQMRKYR